MILHHSAIDSKATLITSHSNFIFLLHILNIGLFSEFHIQARNLTKTNVKKSMYWALPNLQNYML